MRADFAVRASLTGLRHPWQGIQRIGGRLDTRKDLRELVDLAAPQAKLYQISDDWERRLDQAIGVARPCRMAGLAAGVRSLLSSKRDRRGWRW